MAEAEEGASADLPPLVLHVDINKTLIICDPVSGVETEAMVNSLLSECSWGIVDREKEDEVLTPRSWRLLSPEPSPTPPADLEAAHGRGALMTYNEFLEGVLKPDKMHKKQLKGRFTHDGEVGAALRPYYHRILEALHIPEAQRVAAAQASPKLARGQYYVLPSFFRLVNHLEESGRDFHLVFRTFGVDTAEVAQEWNLFCEGKHPLFGPSCPDRTRARRLELPRDSGVIHRTSNDDVLVGCVHLAMVDETRQLVALAHGLPAIYARIMTHLTGDGAGLRRSLALQDDYAFWARNGESDDSGKVLIVNSEEGHYRHIFFDDNIERDRAHIVDARDLRTGAPLPFASWAQGRYLVKVEPLESVLDVDYFVTALRAAEARLDIK